ncbi:MAG: type II secretion system protein [Acidobacteria bacterium]|nr:type II secretion system protein [Acidobacteriota bacterium]
MTNPAKNRESKARRRRAQSGYLLLVLLIAVTLLSIAAAVAAPTISNRIRRQREAELIFRGKQYAEAVKRYYKKFHRYPGNMDQLVETNGVRFLRKRYVDPVTGKDDWKLVHQGEATIPNWQLSGGPGIPGAQSPFTPAGMPAGTAGTNPAAGGFSSSMSSGSGFGSTLGSTSGSTNQASAGSMGQLSGGTTQIKPGVGGIVVAELLTAASTATGQQDPGNQSSGGNTNQQSASQQANNGSGMTPASSLATPGNVSTGFGAPGQQIGGGAIIGVASTSTEQSIREFNEKNHYNEWAFIYDPRLDARGPAQGVGAPPVGSQTTGAPGMAVPVPTGQGQATPTQPQQPPLT